jgi:hypothetical protein
MMGGTGISPASPGTGSIAIMPDRHARLADKAGVAAQKGLAAARHPLKAGAGLETLTRSSAIAATGSIALVVRQPAAPPTAAIHRQAG